MEVLEMEIEGSSDEEDRNRCWVCLLGCRRLTTFLLSHVGLISLVVAYCLLGAVTFERLEREHELDVKRNMSNVREEVSNYLWKMTQESSFINPVEWHANAVTRLEDFETELIRLMKQGGWDGNESLETQQWTFSGALFYSIVVITTIGFGHMTPKTDWGKIVTIFYAILGIPLMLLCLSHIGDFMATAFRILYWKICCYVCYRQPRNVRPPIRTGNSPARSFRSSARQGSGRIPRRSVRRSTEKASQISIESAMSENPISLRPDPPPRRVHSQEDFRKITRHDSTKRYSSKSATVGRPVTYRSQQQLAPEPPTSTTRSRPTSVKSMDPRTIAFSPTRTTTQQLSILYNKYAEDAPGNDIKGKLYRGDRERVEPFVRQVIADDEYLTAEEDYSYEDVQKRPVPIWLCVFLVVSYILGGAALFSNWEEWPFLDSAYFCFTTLTTIGFGDFVPAQNVKTDVEISIALCSLYLLFGISLLAMSFNLVQEEVISTVKQIGYGLGIIREEDER